MAQGLGLAFAKRIAASGAKLALWDVNPETLETAGAEVGGAVRVAVDVSDAEAATATLKRTEQAIGPVSILVNSAGIAGPIHTLETYPLEAWRRVIDINLNGTFHVTERWCRG